jgi:DNA-binding NtrC family response regulator
MKQRRNITIMSNDSTVRQVLADALSRQAMDCDGYSNVVALKDRLQNGRPTDLVILDLDDDFGMMGEQVRRNLQDCVPISPIIGISGSNAIPKETLMKLDGLLLKPFEMTELLTLVNQLTSVLDLKHVRNRTETQPILN